MNLATKEILLQITYYNNYGKTKYGSKPHVVKQKVVTKGPFTRYKFFGTARIKMVHVPKNIAQMPRLHILFSAMLITVK